MTMWCHYVQYTEGRASPCTVHRRESVSMYSTQKGERLHVQYTEGRASPCTVHRRESISMYSTQKGEHLHVQYIVPVPYMRSGTLQKRSHQPLSSPVLYRSLEPLESSENEMVNI